MVIDYAIEIISGEMAGQRLRMNQRRITLGRHPQNNEVVLTEPTVSSRHASITYSQGRYLLEDLGSTNKTYVNRQILAPGDTVALHDGMTFRLGQVHLRFHEDLLSATAPAVIEGTRPGSGQAKAAALLKKVKNTFKWRLPKDRRRWAYGGGVLVAVLFCVSMFKWLFASGPAPAPQNQVQAVQNRSMVPIPLPAKDVYGFTRKRDRSHPDKVIFEFQAQSQRVVLVYTPGGVNDAEEVQIRLNGKAVGSAAVSEKWGAEQSLTLPRELIAKGQVNRIEFDHLRNPPAEETWAVRNVSVRMLPEIACNAEEGKRLLALGNERFTEKSVDAGNLFRAVTYFKKAAELGEACTPPPAFLQEARDQQQRSRAELDATYNNLLFAYKKALKLKDYQQTKRHLEAITHLIADTQDIRFKRAERLLTRLNQALANQRP